MDALGGSWWRSHPFNHFRQRGRKLNKHNASSDSSAHATTNPCFPLKQAVTAGSLVLVGDTIAQVRHRWTSDLFQNSNSNTLSSTPDDSCKDIIQILLSSHDWIRALRMTSYGFLFYGPANHRWYQTLDHCLPQPTFQNLLIKVFLNQIVVGPAVIAVFFAWNSLWQGKLSELPRKYQKDALPTLLFGSKFWVPYTFLNFWVVPLQMRVAFMSFGSIFWNFILSSTVSK